MSTVRTLPIQATVLLFLISGAAQAATIDFEGLPDGTILADQYPGLTFSNALILSSGISLNEFEFPPRSGQNVASDNGGPLSIVFATPVSSVSAYFTYLAPLTVTAFDSGNNQVDSATSAFISNLALSGDLGSSPNELLQLIFAGGISTITIAGSPSGGSFTLDDLTYTPAGETEVPEPDSIIMVLSALGITAVSIYLRSPVSKNH